jgi:hypothetical protein
MMEFPPGREWELRKRSQLLNAVGELWILTEKRGFLKKSILDPGFGVLLIGLM